MLLDLRGFRGTLDHLDRTYEPAAFSLAKEEFRLAGPVRLTTDVRKDAQKVRLVGQVGATLECDCSRCLEPFAVPIDAKFDVLYLPATANAAPAGAKDDEVEVREDDLGVAYYKNDVIDLGDLVREQFYLAVPMKPLCREDCRGLCPVCGVNRNRETCSCKPEWVDPRMDPLRKLKDYA